MKKTSLARLMALLLVVIMAVAVMAACGGKDKDGNKGNVSMDFPKTEDFRDLPAVDYNGYEFTFICEPYLDDNAYTTNYMVAEGETGDTLLDSVYKRNSYLSDKYNITFEQLRVTDLVTTVRNQVMGNSTEFDIIIGSARKLATLAKEGHLLDLKSVEMFDMTKSYWDNNAAEELLIGDKLFFTNCDLNVQEIAFVVYFNKQLITEKNLTSPYEYMDNNQWTIDNWSNLVMSIHEDANGDQQYTEVDRYGTLYEHHNGRMFLYGAGVRATTNDPTTGKPVVTMMDSANKDKTEDVYSKVKKVFSSASSWSIDDMSAQDLHGYNDKFDYARSLFCQDLYLFHYEGTNIIHQFADMESEFGIVPFPKYNAEQAEYRSMYPFMCAMVALPTTLKGEELQRTAQIIEDMNYFSSIWVEPAWYETLLKRRHARDDESEANLEIIKQGRVYDVGMYYDFGGLCSKLLDSDVRSGSSISTMYKRLQSAINAEIQRTYLDFDKITDK